MKITEGMGTADSDLNDDHPQSPISKGQNIVRQIYDIALSNPARLRSRS